MACVTRIDLPVLDEWGHERGRVTIAVLPSRRQERTIAVADDNDDTDDELEKVRAALGVASAQIRQDRSFAALQKGHGDLLAALGIDQIPEGFKPDSPTAADDLSRHMRELPGLVNSLPDRMTRELALP